MEDAENDGEAEAVPLDRTLCGLAPPPPAEGSSDLPAEVVKQLLVHAQAAQAMR